MSDDRTTTADLHVASLEEAAAQLIEEGHVPALLDAAENVVIAYGMGLDMDGVVARLREAIGM